MMYAPRNFQTKFNYTIKNGNLQCFIHYIFENFFEKIAKNSQSSIGI